MDVEVINPRNGSPISKRDGNLVDVNGNVFPIIDGVPRIADLDNYANSFGMQWNRFASTQIDRDIEGVVLSAQRLFAETLWKRGGLDGETVLEVGSGAGRFSRVILEHTKACLYSVDYSNAVSANLRNNGHISPDRFHLFQASVYELPFPDNSFDKVLCLGVLQHTPDFEASVKALIAKAKPGGEIVVDFYPVKGWWTKVHAKYLLRPLTTRMSHEKLLRLIERNVGWLLWLHCALRSVGLGLLNRFLPVCDVESFPKSLNAEQLREWVILDTFDQYSPMHDCPQRVDDVASMFRRHGAHVSFAGYERFGDGMTSAVVRGVKIRFVDDTRGR